MLTLFFSAALALGGPESPAASPPLLKSTQAFAASPFCRPRSCRRVGTVPVLDFLAPNRAALIREEYWVSGRENVTVWRYPAEDPNPRRAGRITAVEVTWYNIGDLPTPSLNFLAELTFAATGQRATPAELLKWMDGENGYAVWKGHELHFGIASRPGHTGSMMTWRIEPNPFTDGWAR